MQHPTELGFHHNQVPLGSTPRYHSLDGMTWSYPKTVDTAVLDGSSGYSPSLAVFGTKKYAAYFFRKASQSAPATVDLRLASWHSSSDSPQSEVLEQAIVAEDAGSPRYRSRWSGKDGTVKYPTRFDR